MANGRSDMAKNTRNGGPDLLALAMRRAREDVAAGRVPKHLPDAVGDEPQLDEEPLEVRDR